MNKVLEQGNSLNPDNQSEEQSIHQEAIEFVQRNRDFYEHYARGRVRFEPAPEGLNTFGFDLEADPPKIYLNSRFYKERGLSDEKTSFATLHEVEHLLEKRQLLSEKNGARIFKKYLARLESSQAFNFLDNRVADLRENRAVVSKTNKEFGELKRSMYKDDLVKETDFTAQPRHIQFIEALSREGEVPDEKCVVDPEVREKLDQVGKIIGKDGSSLIDVMTHPDTPMSTRLQLQDHYLWPLIEELRNKDIADEERKRKGDKGGGRQEGQSGEGQSDQQEREKTGRKKKGRWRRGKKRKDKSEEKPEEGGEEDNLDPDEIFKEAYERAVNRVPNAVPLEEVKKAFKEWQESHSENPVDRADREYADKLGVKSEDLRRYRDIVVSLEKIINPETGESVVRELRNLFARIISRRLKKAPVPRYPLEEGEELIEPVEAFSQVKGGNLEPKVWETTEIKEIKGKRFGEVEITLVCDRSSSMREGTKLSEQRRATVLIMEALKEFAEQCDEERVNMDKPLEIRSEVYSFQQSQSDSIPLKKMSKELGEKERIDVATAISSAPGGTTDFIPMETIYSSIKEDERRKIIDGELRKIVIVLSDGESNDSSRVRAILEKLRDSGVIQRGVGITEAGRAALTTYAPDARLAEKAEDLPKILSDLLKEHLADL